MSTAPENPGITLGVSITLATLALACVPKVSAQIVVTDPEPDDPASTDDKDPNKPVKPKRGDRFPPEIIRAEYIAEGHLRLHFSERIVEPDPAFDPNDFRLSVLTVYLYEGYDGGGGGAYPPPSYPGGYGGYGYGYAYHHGGGYSHGSYNDFGYSYYGSRLEFVRWRHAGTEIDLYFTPEISPYACRQISRYSDYGPPGVSYDNGLFLHYAAGAIPLRDEDGYPLSNIGADWVIKGRIDPPETHRELPEDQLERAGDGLLEVSCEPQLPPGPR